MRTAIFSIVVSVFSLAVVGCSPTLGMIDMPFVKKELSEPITIIYVGPNSYSTIKVTYYEGSSDESRARQVAERDYAKVDAKLPEQIRKTFIDAGYADVKVERVEDVDVRLIDYQSLEDRIEFALKNAKQVGDTIVVLAYGHGVSCNTSGCWVGGGGSQDIYMYVTAVMGSHEGNKILWSDSFSGGKLTSSLFGNSESYTYDLRNYLHGGDALPDKMRANGLLKQKQNGTNTKLAAG